MGLNIAKPYLFMASGEISIFIIGDMIYSNSESAINLCSDKFLGEFKSGKVYYNPVEALYLVENFKAIVLKGEKKINYESLLRLLLKSDKDIYVRYLVFKDLRNKGHIVKAALKFGGDFRVYERGSNPKNAHSSWILYPMSEKKSMNMHEFASKNRVSHSTRKKLLIAVVDGEGDVLYYEIGWKKF